MNITKLTRWSLAGLLAVSAVTAQAQAFKSQYMVIDLSGGPKAKKYPVTYTNEKPDLDFDTCRTKELWLRLIPAGTFMMGSPADEMARGKDEDLHQVTLTQPFYAGVFQVTQKQYELVMGTTPSQNKGDTRPVTNVSYDTLRGASAGSQWPANNNVDAVSFFGVLRAKTTLTADLPTEAQWEYACRAGTTTAFNSGKELTSWDRCPNMAEVGRYNGNLSDGKGRYSEHTKVGMYLPNAWGLYDMHGNVIEWCLDWYGDYGTAAATDPKGAKSGSKRVARTVGCDAIGYACGNRSAHRSPYHEPNISAPTYGFRIVVLPSTVQASVQRQPAQPSAEEPKEAVALGEAEDALAETCAEFKAIWNVYKTNAEKINAEFQPKIDAVHQQYGKALETLKGTVQRRGDFEKTKAVIAEIERFEETKTLPSTPDEEAIAEIKTLQANAIRPFAALEKDRLSRMATLTRRYGQALEQLLSELVRAGKLDDAASVKEARERAK